MEVNEEENETTMTTKLILCVDLLELFKIIWFNEQNNVNIYLFIYYLWISGSILKNLDLWTYFTARNVLMVFIKGADIWASHPHSFGFWNIFCLKLIKMI